MAKKAFNRTLAELFGVDYEENRQSEDAEKPPSPGPSPGVKFWGTAEPELLVDKSKRKPKKKHNEEDSLPQKHGIDVTRQGSYNSCPLQKLILHKFVQNIVSTPNVVSCLSSTPDAACYQTEFEKFLDFVDNVEEPGKTELARAIFPLFVHFYFNSVQLHILEAKKFYHSFVSIFNSAEGYEKFLEELIAIKHINSVARNPFLLKFRKRKYTLRLSAEVMKELSSFLKEIESKALLQVFYMYFYFEDPDVELLRKTLKKPKPPQRATKASQNASKKRYVTVTKSKRTPAAAKKRSAKELGTEVGYKFMNIEEQLFEEPPIVESFIESQSEISTMDLNQDESEFCVSFGESSIFISPMRKSFPLSHGEDDVCGFESQDKNKMSVKQMSFSAPVHAIKYFPDEPHSLLAASGKEIVKVNTATRTSTSFGSAEHRNQIWDIDINATGSLICSAGRDMMCHLWNLEDSCPLKTFVGHDADVTTVKFHENGLYLLSGSVDCTVRLWGIENAMCLRSLVGHKSPVYLVAFSPDKRTVVSADSDGIVKLWDIQQSYDDIRICDIQCYEENVPDGSRVTSLCFGDEHFLGMCNNKGVMRIWDIRKPEVIFQKIYPRSHMRDGAQYENSPIFLKKGYLSTWNIFFQEKFEKLPLSERPRKVSFKGKPQKVSFKIPQKVSFKGKPQKVSFKIPQKVSLKTPKKVSFKIPQKVSSKEKPQEISVEEESDSDSASMNFDVVYNTIISQTNEPMK